MTDNLRDRIAAAIQQALIAELRERQDYVNGPYFDTDDEGENIGDPLIGIDGSVTPANMADAVIAELGLHVEYVHHGSGSAYRYVTDLQADDVLKPSKPHCRGNSPDDVHA